MARERFVRTVFQKIDPQADKLRAKQERIAEKQRLNQERQRQEAEQRRLEKEAKRNEEKRTIVQQKIREAIERGEITEAEAAMLPDLDESALVTWAHFPYIDTMLKMRNLMDAGEWEEVCIYFGDKKNYNPLFTQTVQRYFSNSYTFTEHVPHDSPYKKWYRKNKESDQQAAESNTETRQWADNLYDVCAPHLVATLQQGEEQCQFGIMTIWRPRFTKHGLSLMARSQFIKAKLFEQEIGMPVFMIFGIGGTAEKPERLFVVPFRDVEHHFIPKPVANRYEVDATQPLHYIPELQTIK